MIMKIVVAPDKFKGSLTSFEACTAIAAGIIQANRNAEILLFPMADGGDGFAEVMKYYLQTDTINHTTVDPLGRKLKASYQWNSKTSTAIIEMAVASGLDLLDESERNPLKTSTFGTGLLIMDAINKGARKIILGLGGSATNDAGTGILSALGFQLKGAGGVSLNATGENLSEIQEIIPPPFVPDVKLEIACDVQNILHGQQGAAYVFAPQKGANAAAVKLLDEGLKHFAEIIKRLIDKDISAIPGTGAAGGIAAGLMSFFDVELKKGSELIIDASGIKTKITGVNLFITGEGKIDHQSLKGKVVGELSSLAYRHKIPVAAFCGVLEGDPSLLGQLHLDFVYSLTNDSITRVKAMANASQILAQEVAWFYENHFQNK
jgi:glycerate kinase